MTTTGKRLFKGLFIIALVLLVVGIVIGAIGSSFTGGEPFVPKPEVSLKPEPVLNADAEHMEETHQLPSGFVVTNTLLSCWIASILLILFLWRGARSIRANQAPRGLANVVEAIIEAMFGFVEGVAGHANARKFFPLFATIFLFVLFNAWLGLLPIYPSLGALDEHGEIKRHLLRPAGTDLNMPLALALVSFVFVEFWGIRTVGLGYFGKFFQFSALLKGKLFQGFVDLFVGFLELLSELIRLVSFTFRLFGNMTAGEILLLVIGFLFPFSLGIIFFGLELFVGFVQALVFSGLTLVFVVMAVQAHEGEEEDGAH
ncbi:MAG: F0F1 ATP synthase subunit A [Chloroflexi bacterium]|nr:F0F1 ATP synthase subunit A [Chloroflexota bacterium]